MYMPVLARFSARDPLPIERDLVLLGATYAYVNNSPIGKIDPSGLDPIPATVPGTCNPDITLTGSGAAEESSGLDTLLCQCTIEDNYKCRVRNTFGESPVTRISQPPTAVVEIVANPIAKFCGRPNVNQYFGPDGIGTSVGVIVQIPGKGGKTESILMAHLSGAANLNQLGKYTFPSGSHGVICGGENERGTSNCTYREVVDFFLRKGIVFDVIDWDGCFVGNDGRYYIRNANNPSDNEPSCFGFTEPLSPDSIHPGI